MTSMDGTLLGRRELLHGATKKIKLPVKE